MDIGELGNSVYETITASVYAVLDTFGAACDTPEPMYPGRTALASVHDTRFR